MESKASPVISRVINTVSFDIEMIASGHLQNKSYQAVGIPPKDS